MGSSLLDRNVSTPLAAESSCDGNDKLDRKPTFSPYARVLTIESRFDLSKEEQMNIWWQDDDYELFKKDTAEQVTSMLNENINGWLGMKDETANNRMLRLLPLAPVDSVDNRFKSSPKRHLPVKALDEANKEELGPVNQKAKLADTEDIEAITWWHRYGDLACFYEAQRRHILAKRSISIVLKEQRRQRMTKCRDSVKIRSSYLDANYWAIKWATALAAARAEEAYRESYGGRLREATMASLYEMKDAVTALVDMPEVCSLQFLPRKAITSVCTSQVRYRQTAIRRPLKRETKTKHLTLESPGDVAGNSDTVAPLPRKPVSAAAGWDVNSSPSLGTSILNAGSVCAIESEDEKGQHATEKQM